MGTALVVYRKHHRIKPHKTVGIRTICEVLREMYRSAEEKSDAYMLTRIEEAYDLAKRMDAKLAERREPHFVTNGTVERK